MPHRHPRPPLALVQPRPRWPQVVVPYQLQHEHRAQHHVKPHVPRLAMVHTVTEEERGGEGTGGERVRTKHSCPGGLGLCSPPQLCLPGFDQSLSSLQQKDNLHNRAHTGEGSG